MVTHQLGQGVQRLWGVDRPCRVARVAQQDGLRLVVDFGGKVGNGRQGEPVVNPRRHGHNLHPCHLGEAIVVGVKRLRHDDLVTWVQARHERKHQGLRPSRGDQNVVGLHVQTCPLVIGSKSAAVRSKPFTRAVLNDRPCVLTNRIQRDLRGLDVRLADVQVNHTLARRLGRSGIWGEFADGAVGHGLPFLADAWHGSVNCAAKIGPAPWCGEGPRPATRTSRS